jgi:ribosomal protein S18 acetylase RimI-like enzyme
MSDHLSPDITLRALQLTDDEALYNLDYSFETDRIYTFHASGELLRPTSISESEREDQSGPFVFELTETPVDPPLYKDYREDELTIQNVQERLQRADGGYVALVDNQVAGCVILYLESWRSLARVRDFIVGRQFRRYGIGSLLLNCAADWARNQNCRAILLETQSINYPAIQFYLHNGFEVWGISRNFYPPGPLEYEAAIFLGKTLR